MCYTKSDIKHFKTYFDDLGIMDEGIMEQILNSLDLIAEIGYARFKNNKKNVKDEWLKRKRRKWRMKK